MTGHSDKLLPSNLIYDTKVNPTHVTCKVTKIFIVKPSGKSDDCKQRFSYKYHPYYIIWMYELGGQDSQIPTHISINIGKS